VSRESRRAIAENGDTEWTAFGGHLKTARKSRGRRRSAPVEGNVGALSFFVVAWTKQDKLEGANDLAKDCAWLTTELVSDRVDGMLRTGVRNSGCGCQGLLPQRETSSMRLKP